MDINYHRLVEGLSIGRWLLGALKVHKAIPVAKFLHERSA